MGHLEEIPWDGTPGAVSMWFGPVGGGALFARAADEPHYAASLVKLPALAALHRTGRLDERVDVVNSFASAEPAAPRYGLLQRHDQDDAVWAELGGVATLGWLAHRMITRSSNLATNLVLNAIGLPAVATAWRHVGAGVSRVERGIGDEAAAAAGLTNTVTAADVARLLGAVAAGVLPGSDQMLATLLAQERAEDLATGLPPGTRVAHKNGWVMGVRHAAGVVFPADTPPFVLAVCATTPLAVNEPADAACRFVGTVAAAAWADRHRLPG